MKLRTFVIASAMCIAFNAFSAAHCEEPYTHLEPTVSPWSVQGSRDNRPAIAQSIFHEAWERDVVVWGFHFGSPLNGGKEQKALSLYPPHDSITFLRKINSQYRVVELQTPIPISHLDKAWIHYNRGKDPIMDYRTIKPFRCETGISRALGDRLVDAWRHALMDTRYYEHDRLPPPDATWWVFSLNTDKQELFGRINEGMDEGAEPAALVQVINDMNVLCFYRTKDAQSELERDVMALKVAPNGKQNERPH